MIQKPVLISIAFAVWGIAYSPLVGFFMPGRSAQAAFPPAQSRNLNSDYLIAPGRVGQITRNTNRQALVPLFGATNLKDFVRTGPEGEGRYPATAVTANGKRLLEILWTDPRRQQVSSVRIYDSRWQTAEGIAVRTSVSRLHQLFGEFRFFGFAWDYGGHLIQSNPKLDQYLQTLNLEIVLGLPEERCVEASPDCAAVIGEQELTSRDAAVRRLNAQVIFLSVRF